MPKIITIKDEAERGCGFRKSGGLYLMGEFPASGCGKLPALMHSCPICGQGIKQARGITKINPRKLFSEIICGGGECPTCPMGNFAPTTGWLLWVGESFYKTPKDFTTEAARQGISRRISAIPKGFMVGKHLVYLAHSKAFWGEKPEDPNQLLLSSEIPKAWDWLPGIFSVFRPDRIEYIVKGDETEEELQRLANRGLTLVKLLRTKKTAKAAAKGKSVKQAQMGESGNLFD